MRTCLCVLREIELGTVTNFYDLGIWEAEVGAPMFEVSMDYSETLSKQQQQKYCSGPIVPSPNLFL